MPTAPIYELEGYEILTCQVEETTKIIEAGSTQKTAICPRCNQDSTRIHSYYQRYPKDLPICGHQVKLVLRVRRFRCQNPDCQQKTFTEQVTGTLKKYARRTNRLVTAHQHIAFEAGGEAGAKLSSRLQMPICPDTALRQIRSFSSAKEENSKVIGIDDFAFKKGLRYGTILIDLEKHLPIDLLPDRSADTLRQWLKEHPGVEVITRDRSREYAKGVREASAVIMQVADRWHLLRNLREALERMVNRMQEPLKKLPMDAEMSSLQGHSSLKVPSAAEQTLRMARRQRRYEQFQHAKELYHQGLPIAAIARKLEVSRTTIYKLVMADSFPERAPTRKKSKLLGPYWDYLEQQRKEGCENASQLFREIQEQGYSGSRKQVALWMQSRRSLSTMQTSPIPSDAVQPPLSRNVSVSLAPRPLAWLLVKEPVQLSTDETIALTHIQQEPSVAMAYSLAQRFQVMVKKRMSEQLEGWIADCLGSSIPDMVNFADGVMQDHDAIRNALHEKWSNGQTEGQVTRLKMLKRKMYGRANFDMLRLRVLYSNSS